MEINCLSLVSMELDETLGSKTEKRSPRTESEFGEMRKNHQRRRGGALEGQMRFTGA